MRDLIKKQKGFTIIEVLIVLAIAGLIILIVFLAVPSLQRNSRNTQRKNDISALLGSIQESTNNNNGQLPTRATAADSGKLSFYAIADLEGNLQNAAAVGSVTPTESSIQLNNFSKCPAANPAPGAIAALTMGASPTKRNVTAVYRIETSGASQTICQDL
ncbi:hypothetical protein A3F37_04040 [Candidatus Saccharibacteria bacterium RIFCSPHIGHO2_12_FULL_41_12]|nr:MAG: hypothetical protein A3F37_04040 [Candidatus Saccharibacteria bacterium RIFCSPHIGHO2_12_FULL_41_12]